MIENVYQIHIYKFDKELFAFIKFYFDILG